ncbi:hypothetical protein RFI_35420 [Reticulomyxa filosa]|uniref:Uncharacterized protein n=1 Tax=Reticulomyxa filosa TaxID=46433 RepID=X6LK91_RETFI|nr:hypothetical protein RFI_35420 [Reticulomyxa filosa]|eukprot:ETO02019.1 hypothetical protein RFI_35420 [Reticulomyxa filosa]
MKMKKKIRVEIHPVSERSEKSIIMFIFMFLYILLSNNVVVFVKKYEIGILPPKKKNICTYLCFRHPSIKKQIGFGEKYEKKLIIMIEKNKKKIEKRKWKKKKENRENKKEYFIKEKNNK